MKSKTTSPIELSLLIVKKEENENNNRNAEECNSYSSFSLNKEALLSKKRQWVVNIILLLLIANFSLGAFYFENIFYTGIYAIYKEFPVKNLWFTFSMVCYMIINSSIPILYGLIIEKYETRLFHVYLTGAIFLGHCLFIIAIFLRQKYFILWGLFIPSFFINPLIIQQELLVIEMFQQDKLGFFISILLGFGKLVSFISFLFKNAFYKDSIYDMRIPLIISSALSFFSFLTCTAYILFENIMTTDISFLVLLLSSFLYPIIGWINDHYGHLMTSSSMILLSFLSLLLPTRSSLFFITLFSLGQSISSIIIILLTLYISKNISIVLGFHRSVEISGISIMQSVRLIKLFDMELIKDLNNTDINFVIMIFIILNMFLLVFLAAFYRHDGLYNKSYIDRCSFTLFNKKSKTIYQDIIFRSKEISLKLTRIFLGLITIGLISSWILYITYIIKSIEI
ncbi:hypothetical protein PCK1_000584 [Pneumocystis canis]|nr:hypothetical protein PCK1_000584 [Pneumocystis canis]